MDSVYVSVSRLSPQSRLRFPKLHRKQPGATAVDACGPHLLHLLEVPASFPGLRTWPATLPLQGRMLLVVLPLGTCLSLLFPEAGSSGFLNLCFWGGQSFRSNKCFLFFMTAQTSFGALINEIIRGKGIKQRVASGWSSAQATSYPSSQPLRTEACFTRYLASCFFLFVCFL